MLPYVLAITGASGAVYATRLLECLVATGHDVHLTISPSGQTVLKQELDINVSLTNFRLSSLMLDALKSTNDDSLARTRELAGVSTGDSSVLPTSTKLPGQVIYHHYQDFMSPIASGSFLTAGMVICPCSGSTLGGIAHAIGDNLVHRAAEVHLKEHRKLILVPRETPLSPIQLANMQRLAEIGAVVLPAAPGWYHGVATLQDLVDFIVARILDQLGIQHTLMRRWGEEPAPTSD
jgi:flavin prenyltransferase